MRAKPFVSLTVVCSLLSLTMAQSTPSQLPATQNQAPVSSSSTLIASVKGFVLEDGTPIKLRLNRNVSSADAHIGEGVDFEVLEEIGINGVTVIPKGSLALGTVTEAQPKRRMARGGKLDMNLDNVRLADGE